MDLPSGTPTDPPAPGSNRSARESDLLTRIEALEKASRAEESERRLLEARVAQQQLQIQDLAGQLRSILSSRIWRILSHTGSLLLTLRARFRSRLSDDRGANSAIAIHCDTAGDRCAHRGQLLVHGWAGSRAGIEWVRIAVDSGSLAPAETEPLGRDARRTVAATFCKALDVSQIAPGPHTWRIRVRSKSGTEAEQKFHFSLTAERDTVGPAAGKPLISVLMPVYNTPERFLRASIDSVRNQTFPDWELCIADDASTDASVLAILAGYALEDPRIRVVYRKTNGHISAATNSCLDLSRGSFIALLDHDDELHPDALARVAAELDRYPETEWIYTDEDKIDESGFVFDPFFKPDWSPEYLLGCMYTCHLSVYRAETVKAVGRFRSEYDGAQDYDLALRISERTSRIRHIATILYHWRSHKGSTAAWGAVKDYAYEAAASAVQAHLQRRAIAGQVAPGPYGGHRVRYSVSGQPGIDIVIATRGKTRQYRGRTINLIQQCVTNIRQKSTWRNFQIVVVHDGGLDSQTLQFLRGTAASVTCKTSAFNPAEQFNLGISHCHNEYIVLVDDNIEVVSPDWLERLLEFCQLPEVGAVGPRLTYPDGTLQHAGVLIVAGQPCYPYWGYPSDHPGYFLSAQVPRNYLAVTGACMMTKAAVLRANGGFDTAFPTLYDLDYCLSLHRRGMRIVFTPYAELVDYESIGDGGRAGAVDGEWSRFQSRWWGEYYLDPYYNPNLPVEYPYYPPPR